MRVYLLIGGKRHAERDWPAVPAIGQHVWVHNVFQAKQDGINFVKEVSAELEVTAVVWNEDSVEVNLEPPDQSYKE